ncbi:LysR family transcriptional regulator substrate-binding protein [Herbiconiux sp. KACC 21604]|uniref:LysR family transcriptional regulator substrate-binding protein n=1 Tax=unclassified Herbiconiux TaxID=2618217 RepID=UPI0014924534|nr:LysR family transcriptional regulator substrate-binding protein [Herbiconiux sp. SALV-R1]QJU55767.1 LysR family transcriptional regulator substrate-binding protein [Herbiconiux sp. SALV-R1]WPO86975.1 LysR family transcriptional regulator substrate-binding protein [Herbiconiux sp. KACC 21604]
MDTPQPHPQPRPLRVTFAPGVTPAKWFRIWEDRLPDVPLAITPLDSLPDATSLAVTALQNDDADVALIRLPLPDGEGTAPTAPRLHAIPLYTEQPVVVVPKDHEIALVESISLAEIAELGRLDEAKGRPGVSYLEIAAGASGGTDAMELVSAGVGFVIAPKPVARLYSRRDVVARELVGDGSEAHERRVALVWRADLEPEREALVDEFMGIVRGRTANSTRGADTVAAIEREKARKPTAAAKEKAAEARAAKSRAGGGGASSKKRAQPGRTRPTPRGKGRRSR